jgi:hypothetical protein
MHTDPIEQYPFLRLPVGGQNILDITDALRTTFGRDVGYSSGVENYKNRPERFSNGSVVYQAIGVIEEVNELAKSGPVEPRVGLRFDDREILKLYTGGGGQQTAVVAYYKDGRYDDEPVHVSHAILVSALTSLVKYPKITAAGTTKRVFRSFDTAAGS